jgi:uncharacterized protein YyaL (SSP411 family)
VVTGAAGDEAAEQLARAARSFYRFSKAVLRVTPERLSGGALPADFFLRGLQVQPAPVRETLPHLRAETALAFVCAGTRCYPPVDRPEKLLELLAQIGRESQAAVG